MSTEVTIQQTGERPLYRKFVRDGVPGNYDVIFEMIRLVRNSVDYDKGIETVVKNLIKDHGLNSYSDTDTLFETLFNFVKSNVVYIQDIAGRIESLKDARQTLSDGWGDCDDHAVLNATLLGCIGVEDVKIAMARYNPTDTNFVHVYCVAYAHGKRWVFDTTLPDAALNNEVKAYEVKELPCFEDIKGLDGFSGAYYNIRSRAKRFTHHAIKMIPSAVNVLPLGFVAGNALATGANMIENSVNDVASLPAIASSINVELDKIVLDLLGSRIAYDLAKTQAVQLAAQLAAADVTEKDHYTLRVVGASIKQKLDFIKNFPAYATEHNIKIVYLDSTMMLGAGVILAAGTGYLVYKEFIRGKRGY